MTRLQLFCCVAGLAVATVVDAQFRRVDTTVMLGDAGYKVQCSNKKIDNNPISVNPLGFKGARPAYFNVKGVVTKVAVDDLNDDGYPDLCMFIYPGDSTRKGNVFALCSHENTDIIPAVLPDIYNDPKLREGYRGQDEFSLFANTLLRTFPIYKEGDTATPTGGKRVVQYKIVPGEGGRMNFKILRSFEKQE